MAIRQCFKPNFKHLSLAVLKKKITEYSFEYFPMYFYVSNLGPTGVGLFWTMEHNLNKPGERTLGLVKKNCIPNFKQISRMVLKKNIFITFHAVFIVKTQDSL